MLKGGKITGKCKIRTEKIDFEDVYFVKELKFNLFSVSQMCDKKNIVLFTDTECVVLSLDFKLLDESQVLLMVPRNNNMYIFDLKNVVPVGDLTCLFAKATLDESNLWHRRLGYINFKTMNKLMRGNLIRGLPSKLFENDHKCVAFQKGKQHKASYIENQMDNKVKTIRCDNGTEFKHRIMNEFCKMKGRKPAMRPFRCPVIILNTLDHLGYSINSKAFRVFNTRIRFVEENLHINFLENKLNVVGTGPNWMFDIDTLTMSINYQPVFARNQTNSNADTRSLENEVADDARKKSTKVLRKENGVQDPTKEGRERSKRNEFKSMFGQEKDANGNRMFTPISVAGSTYVNLGGSIPVNAATLPNVNLPIDPVMLDLEDTANLQDTKIFSGAYADEVKGAVADFNNLELTTVVEKALYGLHQALKAWYETLSTYLLENRFRRGIIDKTLFIKKDKGDLLLVSVYVDDIIFGSTKKSLCTKFKGLMHKKFQMSSMGELTSFLRLSMIGSLMYLTASRPDIMFVVCAYARFQVTPKVSHLHAVKRIFRYLKGQPKLGLWYPKDSSFNLEDFLDSDYAGASLYRKSITGSSRPDIMFVVCAYARFQVTPKVSHLHAMKRIFRYLKGQPKLGLWYPKDSSFNLEDFLDSDYAGASLDRKSITGVYTLCIKQFWATAKVKNVNGEAHIQALVDKKKVIIIEASIRRDLKFEDKGGVDCLSNEVIFEQLNLMGYEKLSQKLTFYKAFFLPQ
nr:putative ribonuclease H-like domain-containing protein [Tanacetum cinerariifolium]